MKLKRTAIALAGIGLASGLVAGPAPAATAGSTAKPKPEYSLKNGPLRTAAACSAAIGSIGPTGMTGGAAVSATRPPTASAFKESVKLLPARVSDTWYWSAVTGMHWWYGRFISGTGLYYGQITWDGVAPEPEVKTSRIGGGWGTYTALASSDYDGRVGHGGLYSLRGDGRLFRSLGVGTKTIKDSYPGFSAVKTMTLLSETETYDTLLATTKGGALYTIRIPVTAPMKPIVKQVRKSTWQGFESIIAEKCGSQGTLLTGIDHDTGNAYLYAIGHAKGTATVIESRGKVPHTFKDKTHHLMTPELHNLFGE